KAQTKSTDTSFHTQSHDYGPRSPSNLSYPSSVKRAINLPNRTIMDLTGDDSEAFADAPPLSSSSSSPALRHTVNDGTYSKEEPVIPNSFMDNPQMQSSSHRPATAPQAGTE